MDREQVQKLLIASANGWATEGELQQLQSALLKDSALLEWAAEWLVDESLLHSEAALLGAFRENAQLHVGSPSTAGQPLVEASTDSPSSRWLMVAAVSAGALACSLLLNVWLVQAQSTGETEVAVQQSEGVRLVRATGCVWASTRDSIQPHLGNVVARGETLKLIQGIAEIKADHAGFSARLRLQGPVVVEIDSGGMPSVQAGRMVAHITLYGEPFTWNSPLGPIEIFESAIVGVDVSPTDASVHVLDGMVRLASNESDFVGNVDTPARQWDAYYEGEAVRVDFTNAGERRPERIAADSSMFAEEQSMATDQLSLGPQYAKVVLESKPAGYWRFDETLPDSVGQLQNEVDGHLALQVIGSVARVRQGNNCVLEFGMTKDSGWLLSQELWPALPLDAYTLECWIKPSHFHNGAIFSLVNPEQTEMKRHANAILVEIGGPHNLMARHTRKNAIRFVNRSPAEFGVALGEACQSEEYPIRQWQHVAAVKQGGHLRLHLNGQTVATAFDDRPVPPQMQLVIGQIYAQRAERPFIGQLDEVAIYEHALTTAEIARHFHIGRHMNVATSNDKTAI